MSREFSTGGWLDGTVPVLTGERKEMSPPIPPKHEASVTPNPSAPLLFPVQQTSAGTEIIQPVRADFQSSQVSITPLKQTQKSHKSLPISQLFFPPYIVKYR